MLINFPSLGSNEFAWNLHEILAINSVSVSKEKMRLEAETTPLEIGETMLHLIPERAVWLPALQAMIMGDLHFGKVNHFRRAGLPVPQAANIRNAERLIDLINRWKPQRIIFLGDLFHSVYNDDWETVGQITQHFPACAFELVRGNHDILSERQYSRYGIKVSEQVQIGNLLLTHEPMEESEVPDNLTNLAGHIHPAARLVGKGRQALTFPCFWKTPRKLILPAFGSFTGLAVVRPESKDVIYIIVEGKILTVNENIPSGI